MFRRKPQWFWGIVMGSAVFASCGRDDSQSRDQGEAGVGGNQASSGAATSTVPRGSGGLTTSRDAAVGGTRDSNSDSGSSLGGSGSSLASATRGQGGGVQASGGGGSSASKVSGETGGATTSGRSQSSSSGSSQVGSTSAGGTLSSMAGSTGETALAQGGTMAGSKTAGSAGSGAAGSSNAQLLSQTGLYESDMRTIRSDVMPFTPRFELWSDGATKKRWLYLPPGTSIDTSDPDFWKFPVGTKVWKEFAIDGTRVETRIVERVSTRSYRMVAYLWRADQSDADAVPNGQAAAFGTDHDVPNSTDCETCHLNQPGRILGVGALQLDYEYAGLNLATLNSTGRLSTTIPAAQLPGDATAQAALGVLHVNCGTCHNPNSTLPYKTLDLWQRISLSASIDDTAFYRSAVGTPTGVNPDGKAPATMVVPGHPESSAVIYRMGSRTKGVAMPPLASKVVDTAGLKAVTDFITQLK